MPVWVLQNVYLLFWGKSMPLSPVKANAMYFFFGVNKAAYASVAL